VWSWRGGNDRGGKVAIPDWQDVALNGRRVVLALDSDVVRKRAVRSALDQLAARARTSSICTFPTTQPRLASTTT
jgi:pyrimidine operon attenuation protein/uracil phosphoribosyltransferase